MICFLIKYTALVSTHSRLKAAGLEMQGGYTLNGVSTHSRLKAAGKEKAGITAQAEVSTHSRLKAAGQTKWAV